MTMGGMSAISKEVSMADGVDRSAMKAVHAFRQPLHSINEAGTTLPTDRWYGSEQVVDRWLGAVRQEVAAETTNPLEEAVSQMRRLVGLDAL